MKYARKKKNKWLKAVIIILCVLLAALIGMIIYMEAGRVPAEEVLPTETTLVVAETESTVPEQEPIIETTLPEEEEMVSDLMISTPYCNLYYPAEWKDQIRTETESTAYGCIVSFYGAAGNQETALFTVFFAEVSENSYPIGTVTHEDTMLDVSVELFDFDPDGSWGAAADDISAMQEGVNYLIDKLKENPAFTTVSQTSGSGNAAETPETSVETPENAPVQTRDLTVSTPYCDLYYPAQWKDAVRYEGQQTEIGYIAVFYGAVNGKEEVLFKVYFAESDEESIPVGIYSADGVSMDVSISLPELPEDNDWTQQEQELFYGLQETANYLLERMKEEPGFTPLEP